MTTDPRRTPETAAGRALFTDIEPGDMWESDGVTWADIVAIEDEARAAEHREAERLREALRDRTQAGHDSESRGRGHYGNPFTDCPSSGCVRARRALATEGEPQLRGTNLRDWYKGYGDGIADALATEGEPAYRVEFDTSGIPMDATISGLILTEGEPQ